MKKYDCKKDMHRYSRNGICLNCGLRNPNLFRDTGGTDTRYNKMPQWFVRYTIAGFGEHETTIRARSKGTAEIRITYALRDLFGGVGGGTVLEIKQIKRGEYETM